jgi:hypothetical protein
MGDPDEQASMMADAQRQLMMQGMGQQMPMQEAPIEGEEEVAAAEKEMKEPKAPRE